MDGSLKRTVVLASEIRESWFGVFLTGTSRSAHADDTNSDCAGHKDLHHLPHRRTVITSVSEASSSRVGCVHNTNRLPASTQLICRDDASVMSVFK